MIKLIISSLYHTESKATFSATVCLISLVTELTSSNRKLASQGSQAFVMYILASIDAMIIVANSMLN
jgi:hypothetical protein